MRLAAASVRAHDRCAGSEVNLRFVARRALHPSERHRQARPLPLEESPHAVVADVPGAGELCEQVLMDPLGRQALAPLLDQPVDPWAGGASLRCDCTLADRRFKTGQRRGAGRRNRRIGRF